MNLEKVLKVTKLKEEECYDITVEDNHNFFANGINIHNCDYRGEIGVILFNSSDKPVYIDLGERIAQMVICRTYTQETAFVEVESLEETERGSGGFGSTGKK